MDDNPPLWHAIQEAEEIVPVVCLRVDPKYRLMTPRRSFIWDALLALDANLRTHGSRLFVLPGNSEEQIPAAALAFGAEAVFASRVYDAPSLERDTRIARGLQTSGIKWETFKNAVNFEGKEVLTANGSPYKVFTPYKRAWLGRFQDIPPLLPPIGSLRSPESAQFELDSFVPQWVRAGEGSGEREAKIRLKAFVNGKLSGYGKNRDYLAVEGTSRLSAHLSHGTISPRQIYWSVQESMGSAPGAENEGAKTFLSELVWREFYYQVLSNFPYVLNTEFKEEFRSLPWYDDPARFEAWCNGLTGYPIVDAAMRQLQTEGWMHNRARMIAASFLTKDLHLDWRLGEHFFLEHLIDADIASNNGGWQWSAGTGTDAAPYFRIFNPVEQSKRFDQNGDYIRTHVPELRHVSGPMIHRPASDVASYLRPIVDHVEERKVALGMYAKRRGARS